MAVLQFGFTPSERRTPHVPENHVENQVVYTGTHDHDTIRGWYDTLHAGQQRAMVAATLSRFGIDEPEPHWALIRLAYASPARIAMVQAQDVLGLGVGGADEPAGVGRAGVAVAARCDPVAGCGRAVAGGGGGRGPGGVGRACGSLRRALPPANDWLGKQGVLRAVWRAR